MSIRQGNNIIAGGGSGGGSEEDNLSITKNASDKIQTIGVIDQNDSTSAIKVWTGVLADLPATKDPTTLYNVTDDVDAGESVYTKTEVNTLLSGKENIGVAYTKAESDGLLTIMLQNLYPVGSIYIGTQSTCPLSTLIPSSTWSLVAQNRALWCGNGTNGNSTIEAGLPNITGRFVLFDAQVDGNVFNIDGGAGTWPYGGASGGKSWVSFDASRSSSIYGKSSTVQPPAYVVNVWRRTA